MYCRLLISSPASPAGTVGWCITITQTAETSPTNFVVGKNTGLLIRTHKISAWKYWVIHQLVQAKLEGYVIGMK